MKDPITQDLAVGLAKVAPPVAVAVTSTATGITLQEWVLITTIVYGVVQTSLTIVRGWGDWLTWWGGRMADLRRVWDWARSRWARFIGRG